MTDITDDGSDGSFLVLRVEVEQDEAPEGTSEKPGWCAHVCDVTSPLAGLYAFGHSIDAVRDGLAVLAWEAVAKGELEPFGYTIADLDGIHVALTTTKEYHADWLHAAAVNCV